MANTTKDLHSFIDRATRSRKYPENTASGLRAALRLFEGFVNEEEKDSLDVFKKNLDHIYQAVVLKKGNDFSAASLEVYKSRIQKVLRDFNDYGIDPVRMASWSPKAVVRSIKKSPTRKEELTEKNKATIGHGDYHIFDFNGVTLSIPRTNKTTEAIMDGELKAIKTNLKDFAEKYCGNDTPKSEEL